jgi:hypothetical protein
VGEPPSVEFQERSPGAEWFRREAADVDFNPIDIDLDDNHIGVRAAGRWLDDMIYRYDPDRAKAGQRAQSIEKYARAQIR